MPNNNALSSDILKCKVPHKSWLFFVWFFPWYQTNRTDCIAFLVNIHTFCVQTIIYRVAMNTLKNCEGTYK